MILNARPDVFRLDCVTSRLTFCLSLLFELVLGGLISQPLIVLGRSVVNGEYIYHD